MPRGGKQAGSGRPPQWNRLPDGRPQVTFQFHPPKVMEVDLKAIAHLIDDGKVTADQLLRCAELLKSSTIEELEQLAIEIKQKRGDIDNATKY